MQGTRLVVLHHLMHLSYLSLPLGLELGLLLPLASSSCFPLCRFLLPGLSPHLCLCLHRPPDSHPTATLSSSARVAVCQKMLSDGNALISKTCEAGQKLAPPHDHTVTQPQI